jgi:tropomyosin
MEAENDKTEAKLQELKTNSLDSEHTKTTAENLNRKVQLLEDELDAAEKNLKETVEKCVLDSLARDGYHDG